MVTLNTRARGGGSWGSVQDSPVTLKSEIAIKYDYHPSVKKFGHNSKHAQYISDYTGVYPGRDACVPIVPTTGAGSQ